MAPHDWAREPDDLTDTAALVDRLNLVISVDISVVQQMLVQVRYDKSWRWLRNRIDSPCYPTAWQFRQRTPGGPPGVIRYVADASRTGA